MILLAVFTLLYSCLLAVSECRMKVDISFCDHVPDYKKKSDVFMTFMLPEYLVHAIFIRLLVTSFHSTPLMAFVHTRVICDTDVNVFSHKGPVGYKV